MAKNPYLDVIKQIVANAVGDRQATGQQSDQQKTQAWTNYQLAQKNLATGLAQQGVSGGGSESALLGANVGYQNTLNTVNAQKGISLNNIARDATANKLTAETQSADWVANAQAVDEQRFANTITGYDTIAKVDNAIAAAKANGQGWKVNYLMAQRAALKEQAKYLADITKKTTQNNNNNNGPKPLKPPKSPDPLNPKFTGDVIRPAFKATNELIFNSPSMAVKPTKKPTATVRVTQPSWPIRYK